MRCQPWIDFTIPPRAVKLALAEAQTHRRFLKTHLPVDALVYSPKAQYIHIGRDVLWSFHNHLNGSDAMYDAIDSSPDQAGPPLQPPPDDICQYWREWMDGYGYPYWSFWENVRSWWEICHLHNILLVHFDVLKKEDAGGDAPDCKVPEHSHRRIKVGRHRRTLQV